MRARDVMTRPVITVGPRTPVHAAAALLVAHGFGGAPVTDADGALVGIVTEADLVRGRIPAEGRPGTTPPETTVADVMTTAPLTARSADDLAELVATMLETRTRSVPIVDDGALVGIITRRDVLRCVARRELTSADVAARRADLGTHRRGSAAGG
ncbi:CBS domain-containing protein [Pseudonocardia sp. CA-107938]|uniref:CBS domain-containing protein n=1 Tax=Pseudonocardia sp. CA-107938 TaxID=3240021 RepID=UPI003D8E8EB4